jgi:RsiW-degrading membrane proteinase PrsW (M82 family)
MADGVYYAFVVSLGFATLENILYFVSISQSETFGMLAIIAGFRAIFTLLMHMTAAGMIGYALGRQKFSQTHNMGKVWIMVFVATLFHSIYNVLLNIPYGILFDMVLIIVCFILLIKYSGTQEENVIWQLVEPTEKP